MSMKLVVAIVQNDDADDLLDALIAADYRATRLASTGGFLRQGNTTIIVGIPEAAVSEVLNIVAAHTSPNQRQPVLNPFPIPGTVNTNNKAKDGGIVDKFISESLAGSNPTVQTGRATVFVLNLERYERI